MSRLIIGNGGIVNPTTGNSFMGTGPNNSIPVMSVFTCPDDANNVGISGGLSYVANAGYINSVSWGNVNPFATTPPQDFGTGAHDSTLIAWSQVVVPPATSPSTDNSTQDAAVAHATGVFWRNDASGFTMTQDYIQRADGGSHTFLLSENVNAGFWADTVNTQRRDLQTGYIAFGVSTTLVTGTLPQAPNSTLATGAFGTGYTGTSTTAYLFAIPTTQLGGLWALTDGTGTGASPNDADMNSNLQNATNGKTARPSSNHPNIVLFCFADGHALPLSQSIDIGVYMRAITPGGSLFGQVVDGDVH
jgi:hypothetical protein